MTLHLSVTSFGMRSSSGPVPACLRVFEAMPKVVQPLTLLNPIAHFATIARSVLVKGAGLDVVYPNLLALIVLAALFVGVSAWRFRRQLG